MMISINLAADDSFSVELNPHFSERILRRNQVEVGNIVHAQTVPQRSAGLIIRKYVQEATRVDVSAPRWQQIPELPSAKELLAPSPVLLEREILSDSAKELREDLSSNVEDEEGDDDAIQDLDSTEPHQLKSFNKTKGCWSTKERYLRTHYKLLREDALRKLRLAIATLIRAPTMNEAAANGQIGLYDDVRSTVLGILDFLANCFRFMSKDSLFRHAGSESRSHSRLLALE